MTHVTFHPLKISIPSDGTISPKLIDHRGHRLELEFYDISVGCNVEGRYITMTLGSQNVDLSASDGTALTVSLRSDGVDLLSVLGPIQQIELLPLEPLGIVKFRLTLKLQPEDEVTLL